MAEELLLLVGQGHHEWYQLFKTIAFKDFEVDSIYCYSSVTVRLTVSSNVY